MRIYIDEAGAFVVSPRPQSYSLVLALIIPSANEAQILYEFLRLRDGWPSNEVEIKGSRLDESQAAQVIELLCHYEVLVKFFAVNMATHADWNVEDFKMRQASNVTV